MVGTGATRALLAGVCDVIDLLFWALLRFFILIVPLVVALWSARRAFLSVSHGSGRSAPVWMAFAGFAAVSGISLLPWAMHLQPVNAAGLFLSTLAVALWPVLGMILRRPADGSPNTTTPEQPVFRHARVGLSDHPGPVPPSSQNPAPADDLWLPFLPPARPSRLQ
jgi:hypothetical protein